MSEKGEQRPEGRGWNRRKRVAQGPERERKRVKELAYEVNDVDKVNSDRGGVQIRKGGGVVDELRQLPLPHLLGLEAKHKQHGVNHIGLATPVGSNHRGE